MHETVSKRVVKGLLWWGKSNLCWRGTILQQAEIASYFLQPFYMYVISWCIKLFKFVFLLILQALILIDKLAVPSSVSDLNRVRIYWPLLRLKELCHYWIFIVIICRILFFCTTVFRWVPGNMSTHLWEQQQGQHLAFQMELKTILHMLLCKTKKVWGNIMKNIAKFSMFCVL